MGRPWWITGALLLLLLIASPAKASDEEWTKANSALEWTFIAITVFDVWQTDTCIKHGGYEWGPTMKPFVGEHPNTESIIAYNIAWMGLHYLVSRNLKGSQRTLWQSGTIAYTTYCVVNSYGTQIIFSWKF